MAPTWAGPGLFFKHQVAKNNLLLEFEFLAFNQGFLREMMPRIITLHKNYFSLIACCACYWLATA